MSPIDREWRLIGRQLDQMRQEQKATVGLAKAGRHKKIGLPKNPIPTLADAGIDKNLANEGRKQREAELGGGS